MQFRGVVRRGRRPPQRSRPARVGRQAETVVPIAAGSARLLALLDGDLDESLVEQLVGDFTERHGTLQSPRTPAFQLAVQMVEHAVAGKILSAMGLPTFQEMELGKRER